MTCVPNIIRARRPPPARLSVSRSVVPANARLRQTCLRTRPKRALAGLGSSWLLARLLRHPPARQPHRDDPPPRARDLTGTAGGGVRALRRSAADGYAAHVFTFVDAEHEYFALRRGRAVNKKLHAPAALNFIQFDRGGLHGRPIDPMHVRPELGRFSFPYVIGRD